MPERAIAAATERIHELAAAVTEVRELLTEEKEARARERVEAEEKAEKLRREAEEKADRLRRGHRRLIAAVALLTLALVTAVWVLAWVIHENERDRCESANLAKMGNRVTAEVGINAIFDAGAQRADPPDDLEPLRERTLVAAMKNLDETQPITDC